MGSSSRWGEGGGALEYNLTEMCLFFKNLQDLGIGKKIAFPYSVSELLDYKNFEKQ